MRPLVAWVDRAGAWIDGERAELQVRKRSLGGCVAYYPQGTDVSAFERIMLPQDEAFILPGNGAGASASFAYRRKASRRTSVVRVVPASSWGIETRSAAVVAAQLPALVGAVDNEGWAWGRSASSIAGRVLREYAEPLRQLPPRWRALAHDAIHQGPVVSVRGGATWGQEVDRTRAFLRALYEPVPVPDTLCSWPGTTWDEVREGDGIVRAVVHVEPDRFREHVPPLPVRTDLGTVHPCGTFRGAWTIPVLRAAEERGEVIVERVDEVAVCVCEPWHADAAERIEAIEDATLRKLVYTRYWGRLAARGGFAGHVEPQPGATQRDGSALWWAWTGTDVPDHDAAADYRPDHAAYIAGRNLAAMGDALARIRPGRVVGVHVDAIWLRGAAPELDGFAVKAEGPIRWYGAGTYRIGDKLAAQGCAGTLSADRLEKWGRRMRGGNGVYREWRDDVEPSRSAEAVSDPVTWQHVPEWPVPGVPSVDDPAAWTPRGWADAEWWATAGPMPQD